MMPESRQEKQWLLWFTLLVLIITTMPYILAYSQHGTMRFTGFVFGVEDGNSYIAKMLSGANGAWLFRSPYSAYEQEGFLAFFPYILLGKLSSPPAQHEQLVFLFHAYRWAAVFFLVFMTYRFTTFFLVSTGARKIATVIATAGGGLGWLSIFGVTRILQIELPLEFYSPETFGFLSVFGLPHLAAARGLLLLGLICYLRQPQSNKNRIIASLSWLMLGFFQPLTIVTGWALLAAHIILLALLNIFTQRSLHNFVPSKWKGNILTGITMVVVSSPWVIYNLVSFSTDRYLSGWQSQNIIQSPPPIDYLFSFGLILPFIILAIWWIVSKSRDPANLLLVTFVFLFPVLAYAPFNLQRRLPEGIWVVLTTLAFMAISRFGKSSMRSVSALVLIFSLMTSLLILVGSIQVIKVPAMPLFRPAEEVEAFEFIRRDSPVGGVVSAAYLTSNALPAWAPVSVLTGHGPESANLEVMEQNINRLYSGAFTDKIFADFMAQYAIDYVFYGPIEKAIGDWHPEQEARLQVIYDQPPYQVFRVIDTEEKIPAP
jgi:hypothetical protein